MQDPPKNDETRGILGALWSLSFAMFVVGTTSLIVLGIGLEVTTDFRVPAGHAGWLVTLFAGVFAVTAPLSQWALYERVALHILIRIGLFLLTAGLAWGCFADSFNSLLVSRCLCAFGGGLVGPSSAALALRLAPEERRGKALATVFSGFTLASVIGVPMGTWLGLHLGWRGAIATVGVIALTAFVFIIGAIRTVPDHNESAEIDSLPAWRTPPSAIAVMVTTVGFLSAQFVVYSVMAAFLVDARGLLASSLPVALLAFGIAGVMGNAIAGVTSDRFGPNRIVWLSHLGLSLMFVLLMLDIGAAYTVAVLAGCAFMGTLFTAPQQARLTKSVPASKHGLLLGFNVSASYIGIAVGSGLATRIFDFFDPHILPITALGLLVISSGFNSLASTK